MHCSLARFAGPVHNATRYVYAKYSAIAYTQIYQNQNQILGGSGSNETARKNLCGGIMWLHTHLCQYACSV